MIPNRFATEYPERCLQLIEAFEGSARWQDLLGSFSIMVAASVLLVPLERTKADHPITQERDSDLTAALKRVGKQNWLEAEFWKDQNPGDWRFSRVMGHVDNTTMWRNAKGKESFSQEANTISKRESSRVLFVLRNALAHGNIVYLAENGHEEKGSRVTHLAFLSRCESEVADNNTYNVVIVGEEDFLTFIKAWASWVVDHHQLEVDDRIVSPIDRSNLCQRFLRLIGRRVS